MGQGGKLGAGEGSVSGGTGEMKHWVRGKSRTLQEITLDIAPRTKVWRGGQNKGRGTHKAPGRSWMAAQD